MLQGIWAEAQSELITLGDLIRWAVSRFQEAGLFYGHGTDNAWDEAVYLISHTLHLPVQTNLQLMTTRLTATERNLILALLHRRVKERIPVAYLTKEAWFAGIDFYIDNRVLIPRSPIAELIEQQFMPWIDTHLVKHILDLGTGSGCIACACATLFPDAQVDAVDISNDALAVAQINVERHNLQSQIQLYPGDLFTALPAGSCYDIIVSNPPYVNQEDLDNLPPEYRHEPKLGLAAGLDGLAIIMNILREAINYLNPNGILVIEAGNSEVALVERLPEIPFYWLEFVRGGGGVFLLTAEQLRQFHPSILKNQR